MNAVTKASGMPRPVQVVLSEAKQSSPLVSRMWGRREMFQSPLAAALSGIVSDPTWRARYEETLDVWFGSEKRLPAEVGEAVVGGGLHAAIYCAVRVLEGHPKPTVFEASDRVGGAFAVSREPSFYLNSRNRRGKLGQPGDPEALNYFPGAVVQPAELSGDEYQPNSTVALAVRSTLAAYANVVTGHRVTGHGPGYLQFGDVRVKAERVVYATGLGAPREPGFSDGRKVMTCQQFFAAMDYGFPLDGATRVAVVGGGDGARITVEALIGQGPRCVAPVSMNYAERIDWYGIDDAETCATWEAVNRSRYKGIGRALPREVGAKARLMAYPGRAEDPVIGFQSVVLERRTYDLVIWAVGFDAKRTLPGAGNYAPYPVNGRPVGRMMDEGVFVVGPAAMLPKDETDSDNSVIPENSVAVFRYADRTASLASHLGAVREPSVASKQDPDYESDDVEGEIARRIRNDEVLAVRDED